MSSAPRPSLTERRKAETRMEIARTAAALFAERGAAVTAEEIARAADVAPRTFYRYFRTKQDAVAPLLADGVRGWIANLSELAARQGELTVQQALEKAARRALTPDGERAEEALRWTRGLLRAMPQDPALRSVWLQVHHDCEEALVPALQAMAPRAGRLQVRLAAAAANTAMRIAVETWAEQEDTGRHRSPAALAVRCLRDLGSGLSVPGGAQGA